MDYCRKINEVSPGKHNIKCRNFKSMKEIFLIGGGIIFLVICCMLTATGDSFIFLDISGSTWATLAGIGALATIGYFFFGK
jgi:hypothetical protein